MIQLKEMSESQMNQLACIRAEVEHGIDVSSSELVDKVHDGFCVHIRAKPGGVMKLCITFDKFYLKEIEYLMKEKLIEIT